MCAASCCCLQNEVISFYREIKRVQGNGWSRCFSFNHIFFPVVCFCFSVFCTNRIVCAALRRWRQRKSFGRCILRCTSFNSGAHGVNRQQINVLALTRTHFFVNLVLSNSRRLTKTDVKINCRVIIQCREREKKKRF